MLVQSQDALSATRPQTEAERHEKVMADVHEKRSEIEDKLKALGEKSKQIADDLKMRRGRTPGSDADADDDEDEDSLLQTRSKESPETADGWTETGNLDPEAKSDFDTMLSGIQDLKSQMQKGMQNVESLKLKLADDLKKHPGMAEEDSPHAEALLEVGTKLFKNMRDTRTRVQALQAKLAAAAKGAAEREAKAPAKLPLDDNSLAVAIGAISGMAMGPEQASSLLEKFTTTDTLSKAFKAGLKLGTNTQMLKEGEMSLMELQSDPDLLSRLKPFVPPGFQTALQHRLDKQRVADVAVAADGHLRAHA